MAKLKVKKGLEANLPAVEDGSLLITTDSKKLYLDNGEERIQVGGDSGSSGTYLFHLKFTDATETVVTNIDGDSDKLYNAVQNGLCVIARVHDYENMQESRDFYLFNEYGSSEGVSGPFRFFRVSDKGELQIIGISSNSELIAEIPHTTRNLSATILTFTKSTTSDSEYSCSVSVTDISNTSGTVLGKVRNDSNVSDTYFYRVYNVPASETADGEVVTFVSCDGNTIKKLTSQYSDQGVWHYSEQSLSGGGADSSIYTSTGIKTPSALTDGFPVMNNDASVTYARFNQGKTTLTSVTGTVDGDPCQRATITAQPTSSVARSVLDLAVRNTTTISEDPNGLSLCSYSSLFEACPLSSSTTNVINRLGSAYSHWDEILVDRISGEGLLDPVSKNRQLVLSSNAGISNPTSSDYAFTSFKFNTQCAGGPQGTGTYNNALIYGFNTAINTSLYSEHSSSLGLDDHPWLSLYLGGYDTTNIINKGRDLSSIKSGSVDSTLFISNALGVLPTTTTSTAGGTSYIKLDMNSWYQPTGTIRYIGKGQIIMSTFNNSSQVRVKLYPSVTGSANLLSPSFTSYLGDSEDPWDFICGKSISAGGFYNHPGINNVTGTDYRVPVFWGLVTSSTVPTSSQGVREGDMCYMSSSTGKVSLRIYSSNTWCTLSIT